MMLLALALTPVNTDIAMIGLGGGFIPRLFQEFLPDARLSVAEVDPLVAEVASTYFSFTPGGNVTLSIKDGMDHLISIPPEGVDQIWLDAFTGNYIPPHMATDGFMELCHSRLRQGGMLVQNLHQTRMECYRSQLRRTIKFFGGTPLVFAGKKSANAVVMTARTEEGGWIPPNPRAVTNMAREFGPKVGPYNLLTEAMKRVANPTLDL
jgi:spermidine synthase